MNPNKLIAFLFLIFLVPPAFAQYWEAGMSGGVSKYRGDIDTRHIGIDQYQEAYGVFARYNLSPWISAKAFVNKAVLLGSDKWVSNHKFPEQMRNLNFRTDLIELGISYEFNLTGFDILDNKPVSPYVFAGLLGFYYNPQTRFQDQWIDLQPLGTEGQMMYADEGYHRYNLAIPFGMGFRFGIGKRIGIGLELGARKTFSDYLDDVSGAYPDMEALASLNPMAARLSYRADEYSSLPHPNLEGKMRGNPSTMDWYYVSTLSMSIRLGPLSTMEFDHKMKPFYE
ncbi:MAG: outer membrane beta-barrel protein [Saprospiraceae bacterium]|nr:outer membrane beta-barrel protein [Saprospiraceae bacterium]